MAAPDIKPAQIPPGRLLTYYGDLASGAIVPEDIKIDALSFRATIGADGSVLSQDPGNGTVQVLSRYNLALETVRGSILNPELAGAAPGLVKFNLREQGRNFSVFKQPVDFAQLVESCSTPLAWYGTYICVPGTQFEVEWFIDPLWATLVGLTKRLSITVTGSYVACDPTQQ